MKKKITAPHLRIYNTIEDDINIQMNALDTEFNGLVSVNIVLSHNNNLFSAKLIVNGRKMNVKAEAKADLISTVIDTVFIKAERQIRKHFDKQSSHRHRGVSEIERFMRDKYYAETA